MKKRFYLLIAALMCIMCIATSAAQLNFTDVSTDAWYYDDLKSAVEMGLINGKTATTYGPDDNLTYAEAIKLAACMHQLYTSGAVTLQNGEPWYQTYVEYCEQNGIITKEYDYADDAYATRAGYMEIFANALPAEALKEINSVADGSVPDVASSEAYAPAVYKLYRAGIVGGVDEEHNCDPTANIVRSEVAVIITRMMDENARVKFTLGDVQTGLYFDILGIDAQKVDRYVPGDNPTGYIEVDGEKLVPEYIMKVNGVPVSLEEYRYYYSTVKRPMDGGNDILWTDDAPEESKLTQQDADSIKKEAEMFAKQYVLFQILAQKHGVAFSDNELEQIELYIQQSIRIFKEENSTMTYEQAMEENALTENLLRYILKTYYLSEKVLNFLYFSEDAPYGYDDETVLKVLTEDFSYIRVQHLLVTFPEDGNEETAKAKAQEALDKINAGVDFMEIVAEYNEDPGMDYYGEDGYYFGPGYMVKEFEDASFALEEGAVSDLVRTDYGYHIIRRMPLEIDYINENIDISALYSQDFNERFQNTLDTMEVEYAPEYELITPLNLK